MKSTFDIPKRRSLKEKYTVHNRPKRSFRAKLAIGTLTLVALASFLVLVFPYIPRLVFLITRPTIDASSYQQAAEDTKKGKPATKSEPAKAGNRLILPGIGVDTQIIEGRDIYVIGKNQGAWRETSTVSPDKDGNLVLAAHRWIGYNLKNVGQFYNLPELKVGSKVYIRWENKTYEYEVYNTRSVLPTQVDIRDADPKVPRKLTMYTCFPLGSTAQRYVVEAKQL